MRTMPKRCGIFRTRGYSNDFPTRDNFTAKKSYDDINQQFQNSDYFTFRRTLC